MPKIKHKFAFIFWTSPPRYDKQSKYIKEKSDPYNQKR